MSWLPVLVKASYFAAALLFILGIKRMASPVTARSGIRWAGLGMVIATVATFLLPDLHNLALIVLALVIGTALAWISGKKVAITDMPQIAVHTVPSADAPTGMGEPGLPPLAPAFANAVARLTGKPLRELPFRLA